MKCGGLIHHPTMKHDPAVITEFALNESYSVNRAFVNVSALLVTFSTNTGLTYVLQLTHVLRRSGVNWVSVSQQPLFSTAGTLGG